MTESITKTVDTNRQTVIVGGDFAPIGRAEALLSSDKDNVLLNNLKDLFYGADLVIVNLECPLITCPTPMSGKKTVLSADVSIVRGIKKVGIDIVGLANNHVMDHGENGFASTTNALQDANIEYLGAGKTIKEARQLLIREINSVSVGLIAVAEHEFSIASENLPGANPLDITDFVRNITDYKKQVDHIIVLYHGGKELYPYPSPRQMDTCRFMVEQGASAVICQHSHCPGCYEEYRGGLIVYGQGNLLFDMYPKEMPEIWHQGFLVNLAFMKNRPLEFSITPFINRQGDFGVISSGKDCKELADQITDRNEKIKQKGFIDAEWLKLCDQKRYEYLSYMYGYNRTLSYINKKIHFTDLLYSRRAYNLILNIIRCETHRELLETILRERPSSMLEAQSGEEKKKGRN